MNQNPTMPNIFRDEEGSVMTEFLIVAPFLFTIVFGIFFYTDLNRFQIAAQQHAYVQAWRGVAMGNTSLSASDELNITGMGYYGGVPDNPMVMGMNLRTAMMTIPPMEEFDWRAALLYTVNNIEDLGDGVVVPSYQIQGMPINTFDKRALNLAELGGSGDITYRNTTYLTPLWGAANSFIGKRDQEGADAWIAPTNVTIPARQSIMNDPYSVYWQNKGKRLRYVDRFTIMRDPQYLIAGIAQTVISGKFGIISEFPTILDDLGYTALADALSFLDNPVFEAIGDILDFIFWEQAQPLRKVDKRMDPDHDVGLEADYGTEKIPSYLKLKQNNSDRWTAIQ